MIIEISFREGSFQLKSLEAEETDLDHLLNQYDLTCRIEYECEPKTEHVVIAFLYSLSR